MAFFRSQDVPKSRSNYFCFDPLISLIFYINTSQDFLINKSTIFLSPVTSSNIPKAIKDFCWKVTFVLLSCIFLACYYDYKNVSHITLDHYRAGIMHVAGQHNRSAFKPLRSYFSVTKPLLSSMLCIFEQQNLG